MSNTVVEALKIMYNHVVTTNFKFGACYYWKW